VVDERAASELCLECERAAGSAPAGDSGASSKHNASRLRAAARAKASEDSAQLLSGLICTARDAVHVGTLRDGRVYVARSRLGESAGLGLFAGIAIGRNERITTYAGPTLFREQLPPNYDTSYVLRVPDSGGTLIDGKPYADAIYANKANPLNGRYVPTEGSVAWQQGVASMANDPRDAQKYNARIVFSKPQGSNKALCELAPMIAELIATRHIAKDEEVYFKYGSEKPFEHFRKAQQRRQLEMRQKEKKNNICMRKWIPVS